MAKIKFYRGEREKYFGSNHEQYSTAIYFATDTQEILVNGVAYGLDSDTKQMLSDGQIVKNVSVADDKITISWIGSGYEDLVIDLRSAIGEASESKNGLMSAAHVQTLNELADLVSGGEGNNISSRLEETEKKASELETSVNNIKEDLGEWTNTTETIASAIGGIVEDVTEINEKLEGLTGAMHFIGTRESVPSFADGAWSDGKSYVAGDVILVGDAEYICNASNVFELFGQYGDLATKSEVKTVSDNLDTLKGRVDGHDTKIGDIEGDVAQNAADIAGHDTEFVGVKSRLDSVEDSLEWCEPEEPAEPEA